MKQTRLPHLSQLSQSALWVVGGITLIGLLFSALPLQADSPSPDSDQQRTSNLVYSTFIGGSGNDCFPACAIAVDGGGSVYLAGYTASTDFPIQSAVSSTNHNGDIFIARFNANGDGLDYATYLGGSGTDYATAIAVDSAGNATIAGYTDSPDFPTTPDAAFPTYAGGYSDGFLVKLNPTGDKVIYATYLGGADADRIYGLAVDATGSAVVVGETASANFPVTANAAFSSPSGGGDAFVAQFNPAGQSLTYATYIGGSARDEAHAVALDHSGQVYLTGKTASLNFGVTDGAFQPVFGGLSDAFVVNLDPLQGTIQYATFLGGSSNDSGEAITVDPSGNAYIAGSTISPDFVTSQTAFSRTNSGSSDAFVVKLTATGRQAIYATLIGGKNGDRAQAIAVDNAGSAYISGATYSADFPVTGGTFDSTYNYGYADAFLLKLSIDGSKTDYATFLGGSQPDYGTGLAIDGTGSVYLAGATMSPSFPVTVHGFDSSQNIGWDGFVTKIRFTAEAATSLISGVIRDQSGGGVPGVVISAGSSGSTTTDSNGVYVLIGLDPGIYTLTPIKSGFTFSPLRRTINVPTTESVVIFTGVSQGNPPDPFLDLPLDYGDSIPNFNRFLQDTENQGWITSWFDHAYPDYQKNGRLALGDGLILTENGYNLGLGCYNHRCYDGHDGIDFIYRDFQPGLTQFQGVQIYAAAAGQVVSTRTGCVVGDKQCGYGLGNSVVIDHQNGYFTVYGHLSGVKTGKGQTVAAGTVIGVMGNTGNSTGSHLHFGLYRDNGNGKWDGTEDEKPVDPFGWNGTVADPWVVDRQGPVSVYLWKHSQIRQSAVAGNQGTVLYDPTGTVEVAVPANALPGQSTFELQPSAVPDVAAGNRSVGQSFVLSVLEWLPGNSAPPDQLLQPTLAQSITLNTVYDPADLAHLDAAGLSFYRWNADADAWQAITSTVDPQTRLVKAQSAGVGQFEVQAPLICPADSVEPDDNYYSARQIDPNGQPVNHLFDSPADTDWFYFEAKTTIRHVLQTENLSAKVDTVLEVYDLTTGNKLATADNGGTGAASWLAWYPPHRGTYFVRVSPAAKSATGCNAGYALRVTFDPYRLYLPLITK